MFLSYESFWKSKEVDIDVAFMRLIYWEINFKQTNLYVFLDDVL